jgi:predicted nuclease of predicted toxin-antitoxin system
MRLLANENVPLGTVRLLRQAGHEVVSMSEEAPGLDDAAVLAQARGARQVVITFDRDYGELIYRDGLPSPAGVLYCRFRPRNPEDAAVRLLHVLGDPMLAITGSFVVIEREQVRVRRLPG